VGLGEGQAEISALIAQLQDAVSAGRSGASEELAAVRSLQVKGGQDTLQALQELAQLGEGQVVRTLTELQRIEGGQGELTTQVQALADEIRAAAAQAQGTSATSAEATQQQLTSLLDTLGELRVAAEQAQGSSKDSTAQLQTLLGALGEQLDTATQQVQGASAQSAEATQAELRCDFP
jgi:chromosome segregation ATPase